MQPHFPDVANTPTARPFIHLSDCVQCAFIAIQKYTIQLFSIPPGRIHAAVVTRFTPGLRSHQTVDAQSILSVPLSLSAPLYPLSLTHSLCPPTPLIGCSLLQAEHCLQLVLEKLTSDTCNNTQRLTRSRALLQRHTQGWTSAADDDDGGCMDSVNVPRWLRGPHWLWIP